MPSVAGIFAIYHTDNRSRWPKLYYYGGRNEALAEGMTDTEVLRIVVADSLSITATILTICKFYTQPTGLIFNTSLWAFPSLQVSLIGIWIIGASYTKTCPRRNILLGGAMFIFTVGTCIGIILMCSSLTHLQAWLPATMLYFFMASPFCLYTPGAFIMFIMFLATIARVGGLAIAAFLPRIIMPSITLKHPLFGTAYLAVGIVGGIVAIYGRFRLRHICLVLKQKDTVTDMDTSLLSNRTASWNTFRARIRGKCTGKHISEKDGKTVVRTRAPLLKILPIIKHPERAYYSELMAEECRRQPPNVHNSPDEEIRRNISTPPTPEYTLEAANNSRYPESIESIFFASRARMQSLRIKRKPVGSGSLKTRTTQWQNNETDKYITDIQKPIPVTCLLYNSNKDLTHSISLRAESGAYAGKETHSAVFRSRSREDTYRNTKSASKAAELEVETVTETTDCQTCGQAEA
ncbi:hypothetical protein ACJ72_03361 [Emergomyces africanus]|uniref:Uncharacterized protein n=1 Tax=Emergomyces africanus TaxID=1955775 RepID=A0A1B7NZT2_9EURO|nr:hypothetical protein ACJ72_03361 [Emergomyces africanus]